MKLPTVFGLIVILASIAFGANALVSNLTPYVTFEQARTAKSSVQVMGKLDKKSVNSDRHALNFVIVSKEGDRMPVAFTATRPANFEMATEVTAIGTFDGTTFRANNLLVKCPTKYQGKETTKSYTAG